MESLINEYVTSWTPKSLPTSTSLSTIDPTNVPGLLRTLTELEHSALTETNTISLYFLSRKYRGVAASMTIISGQKYLATATHTQAFPTVTDAMFNATLNLKALEWDSNLYDIYLSKGGNFLFATLFAIVFLWHCGLGFRFKTIYFSICLALGSGLEFSGYLARGLAADDWSNESMYLVQIINLTMAPAFTMAGIYYLLAIMIVIYGRNYSILKPMWFSYIFIFCDLTSLFIQAIGGGLAAIALKQFRNSSGGTYVMVAGIAFQVFSMTLFLFLYIDFVNRIYFRTDTNVRFSVIRLFHLLFNTSSGCKMKVELEKFYDPQFKDIRSRRLTKWMPLVVLISVIIIYIRCIYRVCELSQGWRGYLITHEAFLMVLEATMVFISCTLYVFFHPGFVIGRDPRISLKSVTTPQSTETNGKDGSSTSDNEYKKEFDESSSQNSNSMTVVNSEKTRNSDTSSDNESFYFYTPNWP